MPYEVEAPNVFGSFMQGQELRRRNALADLEQQQMAQEGARRNELLDLQTRQTRTDMDEAQQDRRMAAYQRIGALAQDALKSGNPRQYVAAALQNPAYRALFGVAGIDPSQIDQNSPTYDQDLQAWASLGPQQAQPKPETGFTLQPGEQRFDASGKLLASVRPNAPAAAGGMTPYQTASLKLREDEIKAQRENRDRPSAAELKVQREIQTKKPRLEAAKRRVERLASSILGSPEGTPKEKQVKGIAKNWFFDGGPVDQYFIDWTKGGQEVVQSSASLLPELTALTRVPGIGSQSDLETRLQSLQLPSSKFAPEVNARALEELRTFMLDLNDAYSNAGIEMGSGEALTQTPQAPQQPAQPAQAPAQQPQMRQAPDAAIAYLRANPQLKEAFRQKYGFLPDGT